MLEIIYGILSWVAIAFTGYIYYMVWFSAYERFTSGEDTYKGNRLYG